MVEEWDNWCSAFLYRNGGGMGQLVQRFLIATGKA
jgi:hypothetical protein